MGVFVLFLCRTGMFFVVPDQCKCSVWVNQQFMRVCVNC